MFWNQPKKHFLLFSQKKFFLVATSFSGKNDCIWLLHLVKNHEVQDSKIFSLDSRLEYSEKSGIIGEKSSSIFTSLIQKSDRVIFYRKNIRKIRYKWPNENFWRKHQNQIGALYLKVIELTSPMCLFGGIEHSPELSFYPFRLPLSVSRLKLCVMTS